MMDTPPNPYMRARQEGQAVWFLGSLMQLKATGSDTAQGFSLIEQVLPPGFAPPLHVHHAEDEAFYILEGEFTFVCGDLRWRAQAGAFIFLPKNMAHGFVVEGHTPARLLQFTVPAGLEQFHVEMGEPASSLTLPPPSAPDMAQMHTLAAKYHFDIVGPPLKAE
ncbi:MAG: cupin domain-containing protein [Ktedonobacterales bacterium]|nr:cupin domain-containing protein [Ktedonobacterales bacterium]